MTAPRFLVDENLSPVLVDPARERGFEAMHVNHLGLRTETDWDLLKVVAEQDWVLVTNNAIEFRGRTIRVSGRVFWRGCSAYEKVRSVQGCRGQADNAGRRGLPAWFESKSRSAMPPPQCDIRSSAREDRPWTR